MPKAVVARQRFGPETYVVASTATGAAQIIGGRLVEFHATETGKIQLCANTDKWLGVALYDAHPGQNPNAASPSGFDAFDYSIVQGEVAVAWTGVFKLDFATAANPGDLVYPAVDGKVDNVVGTHTRPVGIVAQTTAILINTSGYVRLF